MKQLLIFVILSISYAFSQETNCSVSISQGEYTIKTDMKYRKITLGDTIYHDFESDESTIFKDNLYKSEIRKDDKNIDIKIYREPIIDKTQVKTGLRIELDYNKETEKLEVKKITPHIISTKEKYFLFTVRTIQTQGKTLNLELDNYENTKINVNCTIPTLEGTITYIKDKENKSDQPIPVDNSGSCFTKVSELKVSTEKKMEKDLSEPNLYVAQLETINQDIEYMYDTEVQFKKGLYTIEVRRHSGQRSVVNPGSYFNLTLTLDQETEELGAEFKHSRFSSGSRLRVDAAYRRNKFIVSKIFKKKESNSFYVELTRESSKVLISCTSPDVYGSINHSDLVTTDENHRSFMKSISTNDRSEMKEINIEQASPNKTVEVLVPPSE